MKKGDLSINIIIIAVIALIILVIISVLLFGTGIELRTAKKCTSLSGGQCVSDTTCADVGYGTEDTYIRHPTAQCPENQICCIKQ
jgi:hypothetical protein